MLDDKDFFICPVCGEVVFVDKDGEMITPHWDAGVDE